MVTSPRRPGALALLPALALVLACGDPPTSAASETASGTSDASGTTSASASASASAGAGTSEGSGDGTGSTTSGDPPCPAPLLECGERCVDPAHDPDHCGACDQPCPPALACVDGLCAPACGPGVDVCGDTCTDLELDPDHCGACDHACADGVPCVAGACAPTCAANEARCGELCVDLMADEAQCGACGNACPEGQNCSYGLCVDVDVHHLLIGGQSLSNGYAAAVVSAEQPHQNLAFNTGVRSGPAPAAFAPLIESWDGAHGETIASGLANAVAAAVEAEGGSHVILASAHGLDGTAYAGIKKGTMPYAIGLAQVSAGATLAAAEGKSHAVRALAVIHGESDHLANNLAYADDLLAWQSDIEADVQAITGQLHPVPIFLCQMSSFTKLGAATSRIPGEQLAAARARPDRIYVVGPKYFLPYVDGVHLSGEGERWLGEHYAKAYRRVLIDGQPWRPLAPATISREGAVITVDFEVPAPPLVLDVELVSDPGAFGFEFYDSSGAPPTIAAVELVGDTQVRITLSGEPSGGNKRLRYAFRGAPGAPAGPMSGARGNLRDSDATPSANGYPLYNWAIHFDEPVE
ncbi:MAG: hypothetical protein H6710_14300 [Myxococcales bacterium]|nr:hypothetical protein [Myxococcales bacterium]MCB9705082.1 hypothetical protein [Myxococcales bacterium]